MRRRVREHRRSLGRGLRSDARYVPWMLAGEVPGFEVEKRLRRADGESDRRMVSVSLVPDAQERPLYLIVQVQDVTARTRAEAALVESSERVQAIIDNTAGRDLRQGHGRPLHAREPQLRGAVRRSTRERATGRTDDELFPPERGGVDAGQRPARDARARAARGRGGDRPAGRPAHLPVREVPAASTPRGQPYAVCAIATDITRAQARRGDAARVRAALPPHRRHGARRVRVDWTSPGASPRGTRRPRRPSAGPRQRRSGATSPRRSSRRATAATHNRGLQRFMRDRQGARCSTAASSSRRCTATGTSSWSR